MSDVWVIEHGSDPRPARVIDRFFGGVRDYVRVEFTDTPIGETRLCFASSVHPTRAEAVRVEREMESVDKLAQGEQGREKDIHFPNKNIVS